MQGTSRMTWCKHNLTAYWQLVVVSSPLSVFSLDPDLCLTARAYLNTQKFRLFCSLRYIRQLNSSDDSDGNKILLLKWTHIFSNLSEFILDPTDPYKYVNCTCRLTSLGLVSERPISANPGLNFVPLLYFTFLCIAYYSNILCNHYCISEKIKAQQYFVS